jgi:hypothetical protein
VNKKLCVLCDLCGKSRFLSFACNWNVIRCFFACMRNRDVVYETDCHDSEPNFA